MVVLNCWSRRYLPAWKTDTGEKPKRVYVVGDIPGTDALGASGPCIDRSQGGLCVKRTKDVFVQSLDAEARSNPLRTRTRTLTV
jgi:hypothetical protein